MSVMMAAQPKPAAAGPIAHHHIKTGERFPECPLTRSKWLPKTARCPRQPEPNPNQVETSRVATTKILWGRLFTLFLTLSLGVGYVTYPSWKDQLDGQALAAIPVKLRQVADAGMAFLSRYLPIPFQRAEALALLPADTLGVVMMKSPEQLQRELDPLVQALESSGLLEQAEQQARRSRAGHEDTAQSIEQLLASGFDMSRPYALAVIPVGSLNEVAVLFLAPVSDEEASMQALKTWFEQEQQPLTASDINGQVAYLGNVDGQNLLALTTFQKHVLLVVREQNAVISWADVLARLGTDQRLKDDPTLKAHLRAHDDAWQVMMFGSFQRRAYDLMMQVSQDDSALAPLKPLVGTSGSLVMHLTDQQLAVRMATRLPEGQTAESLGINVEPLQNGVVQQLSGEALGMLQLGLQPKLLVESLKQSPEAARELERLRKKLLEDTQLDLDRDVIENLTGQVGMVALKSPASQDTPGAGGLLGALMGQAVRAGMQSGQSILPVGGVFWMGMKNPQVLKPVLDAELERSQRVTYFWGTPIQPRNVMELTEVGGTSWYSKPESPAQVSIGLASNHALMVLGTPAFVAQVQQDLVDQGPSFFQSLPQRVRETYEQSRSGFFYLDLPRTITAVEDSAMGRLQQHKPEWVAVRSLVDHTVRGISGRSWVEAPLVMNELVLHAPENGYAANLKAVAEATRELEAQP